MRPLCGAIPLFRPPSNKIPLLRRARGHYLEVLRMRPFILTLILLVAAFAVAQDTTSPSAPGQSQTQTQSQPGSQPGSQSGQAASPNSSSSMPAAAGEV